MNDYKWIQQVPHDEIMKYWSQIVKYWMNENMHRWVESKDQKDQLCWWMLGKHSIHENISQIILKILLFKEIHSRILFSIFQFELTRITVQNINVN